MEVRERLERERKRHGERKREEPEKKLAGGSYYEPGSRSHARTSRPLGSANKSPLPTTVTTGTTTATAGWRLVPRDFSSANCDLRKKDLRGRAVPWVSRILGGAIEGQMKRESHDIKIQSVSLLIMTVEYNFGV